VLRRETVGIQANRQKSAQPISAAGQADGGISKKDNAEKRGKEYMRMKHKRD
jgi:hypothetical protein